MPTIAVLHVASTALSQGRTSAFARAMRGKADVLSARPMPWSSFDWGVLACQGKAAWRYFWEGGAGPRCTPMVRKLKRHKHRDNPCGYATTFVVMFAEHGLLQHIAAYLAHVSLTLLVLWHLVDVLSSACLRCGCSKEFAEFELCVTFAGPNCSRAERSHSVRSNFRPRQGATTYLGVSFFRVPVLGMVWKGKTKGTPPVSTGCSPVRQYVLVSLWWEQLCVTARVPTPSSNLSQPDALVRPVASRWHPAASGPVGCVHLRPLEIGGFQGRRTSLGNRQTQTDLPDVGQCAGEFVS